GLGKDEGSKPFPGSRTTISMPRSWSQATSHSMILEGSRLQPCTTALAKASVSASSMASSLPSAHRICRTRVMIPCTMGSTAFSSPTSLTLSSRANWFASKVQLDTLPNRMDQPLGLACELYNHPDQGSYSLAAIPSVFIFRYKWLLSRPSTSAVRLTFP